MRRMPVRVPPYFWIRRMPIGLRPGSTTPAA